MSMFAKKIRINTFYEGESDADAAAAAADAAAKAAAAQTAAAAAAGSNDLVVEDDDGKPVNLGSRLDPEVQKKFNGIMKSQREKQKAKFDKELQKTVAEMTKLKDTATLTAQQKADLETRIDEMQRSLMTKEQLAAEEKKKLQTQFETDRNNLTQERDAWKNRFTTSTIERSIVDAAIQQEAFQPDDVIALLKPHTQLVEDKDAGGQLTGRLVPKVTFHDTDGEGKQVTLDLSVPEAVKRMTMLPRYGHLFKTTATGGLGLTQSEGVTGTTDLTKMSVDDYKKQRARLQKSL